MNNSTNSSEFQQYRDEALRSEKPLQQVVTDKDLLVRALRMAEAAADFIDQVKKAVVYGKPLDYSKLFDYSEGLLTRCETLYDHIAVHQHEPPPPLTLVDVHPRLLHAELGTFGESGEILVALLHQIETGELDVKNLEEEDGDHDWYGALRDSALESLGAADKATRRRMNVAKLRARYPEKFSLAESEGRDVTNERQAMEEMRAAA